MSTESLGACARFPSAVDARIDAIQAVAERIWSERDDLRSAYASLLNTEFWIWLAWHGLDESPELKAAWFAQPPAWLLERCAGAGASARDFLCSGVVDWRRQLACLAQGGVRLEGSSILELGCGSGRVLRYFARYASACMFTGADSDREQLAWCQDELGFANFSAVPLRAPCALAAGTFDAVLVPEWLQHLEPAAGDAWVEECARLLRPGGVLVACFLGSRAVQRWVSGQAPASAPTADELRGALGRLRAEGALFFGAPRPESAHPENQVWAATIDPALQGTTFLTRERIAGAWTRRFQLLEHLEAPDDWQDYVLLRRR